MPAPFYPSSWNIEVTVGAQAANLDHETQVSWIRMEEFKRWKEPGPP